MKATFRGKYISVIVDGSVEYCKNLGAIVDEWVSQGLEFSLVFEKEKEGNVVPSQHYIGDSVDVNLQKQHVSLRYSNRVREEEIFLQDGAIKALIPLLNKYLEQRG